MALLLIWYFGRPAGSNGELIFGVKIEDTLADPNCDATISVPGVAFAEYGPGDHSYWLYGLAGMQPGARSAPASSRVGGASPKPTRWPVPILPS